MDDYRDADRVEMQEMARNRSLKLYAYQPAGHGQKSFFICAPTREEADAILDKHVAMLCRTSAGRYDTQGFGTEDYEVTEHAPGQVVENNND